MQALRHFLLAIQFFTRIPVTGALADWVGFSPAMLRASAAHFPGVGVVVGALVVILTALLLIWLPPGPFTPLVAAVLGTVFSVLLTGCFHEDGLADVADGLGGSWPGCCQRTCTCWFRHCNGACAWPGNSRRSDPI
jgi:adenosylcobinamide-GDP ribazoletransferase